MMKRLAEFLLMILCVFILMGCGNSSTSGSASSAEKSQEVFQLVVGNSAGEQSLNNQLCLRFAALAEEASKGRIRMDVYPNCQLGKTREMVEGNISGNIDISVMTTALYTEFIPAVGLFDMHNLFTSLEEARRVLDSPEILKEIQVEFEKVGLKLFGFTDTGFRQLTSSKAVRKLDDFKGFKLRTMENATHIAFWSAMGCNPTPMDSSEVFISLQQGIVDGQENPIQAIADFKYYEVQKFLVLTNHVIFNMIAPFNLAKYNNLPMDLQKIVEDCIVQANKECRRKNDELTDGHIKLLQEKGMEVITLSKEILTEMRSKAAANADLLVRKQVGDKIVDTMLQAIKS
jgi:tripartite ATP-independent transporter DctP family solute receptor